MFLVAQLCPALCNPMDYSLLGSSIHGGSPGKNTGVCCHALLQGIFPTEGSNPGLPHYRRVLYQLSHKGSCLRKEDYKRMHLYGLVKALKSKLIQFPTRDGMGAGWRAGMMKTVKMRLLNTFLCVSFFKPLNLFKINYLKVLRKEKIFLSTSLMLYLYETMDVHWNSCGNHFAMYVSQIITLYTLNLYSAVRQLYLNKTVKQMNK